MTMRLAVDGGLTVRTADAVRQSILDALASTDVLSLDLADGQPVDMCGLQLIESARRYAAGAGKTLVLERPAAFGDLLAAAGFIGGASPQDLGFWLKQEGPQ